MLKPPEVCKASKRVAGVYEEEADEATDLHTVRPDPEDSAEESSGWSTGGEEEVPLDAPREGGNAAKKGVPATTHAEVSDEEATSPR